MPKKITSLIAETTPIENGVEIPISILNPLMEMGLKEVLDEIIIEEGDYIVICYSPLLVNHLLKNAEGVFNRGHIDYISSITLIYDNQNIAERINISFGEAPKIPYSREKDLIRSNGIDIITFDLSYLANSAKRSITEARNVIKNITDYSREEKSTMHDSLTHCENKLMDNSIGNYLAAYNLNLVDTIGVKITKKGNTFTAVLIDPLDSLKRINKEKSMFLINDNSVQKLYFDLLGQIRDMTFTIKAPLDTIDSLFNLLAIQGTVKGSMPLNEREKFLRFIKRVIENENIFSVGVPDEKFLSYKNFREQWFKERVHKAFALAAFNDPTTALELFSVEYPLTYFISEEFFNNFLPWHPNLKNRNNNPDRYEIIKKRTTYALSKYKQLCKIMYRGEFSQTKEIKIPKYIEKGSYRTTAPKNISEIMAIAFESFDMDGVKDLDHISKIIGAWQLKGAYLYYKISDILINKKEKENPTEYVVSLDADIIMNNVEQIRKLWEAYLESFGNF